MRNTRTMTMAAFAAVVAMSAGWAVAQDELKTPAEGFKYVWKGTATPIGELMPEANPVENADATTEAEMKPYTEVIPGSDLEFEMLPIPGGEFTMGSPDDEDLRNDDEGPRVEVEIAPFWMGKCEVRWQEYAEFQAKLDLMRRAESEREATEYDTVAEAVMRPTPPYADMTFDMGFKDYPAICMTQYAAKMYCKWLTAKTGRYYRLPTEAEWEYACRAGTDTAYSFGDDADDLEDYAWFFDNAEDGYEKVGQKKPNAWGLHDMHGNVAEWCLDQYQEDRYQQVKDGATDAFVKPTKLYPRVVRGGSWYDYPESCRSASRSNPDGTAPSNPDWKMQDPQIPQSIWYLTDAIYIGFRLVRPLETPTAEQMKLYEPNPEELDAYIKANGGKH